MSSFTMVPTACAAPRNAPSGPLRFTRKVLFGSITASPRMVTGKVRVVTPGRNVRVPDVER
jgi:hypothetical protein